jgi:flap endonuclease-1
MGIKDFWELIKNDSSLRKRENLSYFKGKRIVVDITSLMFSYHTQILKNETRKMDREDLLNGEVDEELIEQSMLKLLINFVKNFHRNRVQPILIFDGERMDEKKEEIEKRRSYKEKRYEKLETLKKEMAEMDELDKYSKENIDKLITMKSQKGPSFDMSKRIFAFLKSLGIPVFRSINEAEMTACMLVRDKKADAVYSIDSDCFAYLAPIIIQSIQGNNIVQFYILEEVLEKLGFTKQQLIDYCIMCGCDFNKRVFKMGPVTSRKLIKEHGSIEGIIEKLPDIDFTPLKHETCRDIFSYKRFHETIKGYKNPEKCYFKQKYRILEKTKEEELEGEYKTLRDDYISFIERIRED